MTTPETTKLWETYANKLFLTRADIMKAFGCSASTASRLIRAAKAAQKDLPQFNPHTVRTKEAFEAWGIDTDELKKRAKEIMK